MKFKNQRDAAAFLIRFGRTLLQSNVPISEFISRSDNNRNFEFGYHLIQTGRRVALGYQFDDFTDEIYKAHLRATRPGLKQKANDMNQKTIKVETRCWWVTPQRIELVYVKSVVDTEFFYVEYPTRNRPGETTSNTVEMNKLIAFDDIDKVRRRMRTFIKTGESELERFEQQIGQSDGKSEKASFSLPCEAWNVEPGTMRKVYLMSEKSDGAIDGFFAEWIDPDGTVRRDVLEPASLFAIDEMAAANRKMMEISGKYPDQIDTFKRIIAHGTAADTAVAAAADPEIEAMQRIASALADLDTEQRSRVIRWSKDRFDQAIQIGNRTA